MSCPPPASLIKFWVDVSTDWGIRIVFDEHWNAIKLCEGWKAGGCNIYWAEFVAIKLGLLHAISQGHANKHFIIHCDNQGVIQAINGSKSCSLEQNLVLQHILHLLSTHSLWISLLYVPSTLNLANRPSQGLPGLNLTESPTPLSLPPHLISFLTNINT